LLDAGIETSACDRISTMSTSTCSVSSRLMQETRSLLQNFGSTVIHKVEFRENFAMVGQKGLTRGTAIEQVRLRELCW